jgi:hypothetical protein
VAASLLTDAIPAPLELRILPIGQILVSECGLTLFKIYEEVHTKIHKDENQLRRSLWLTKNMYF